MDSQVISGLSGNLPSHGIIAGQYFHLKMMMMDYDSYINSGGGPDDLPLTEDERLINLLSEIEITKTEHIQICYDLSRHIEGNSARMFANNCYDTMEYLKTMPEDTMAIIEIMEEERKSFLKNKTN